LFADSLGWAYAAREFRNPDANGPGGIAHGIEERKRPAVEARLHRKHPMRAAHRCGLTEAERGAVMVWRLWSWLGRGMGGVSAERRLWDGVAIWN